MNKHLTFECKGRGLSKQVDETSRKMMDFIADKTLISHTIITEWIEAGDGYWVVIISIVYQDKVSE